MNTCLDKVKGNLLPLSILFILAFIHFYYLNRYGINVPFSDDYIEILKNMNLIMDSSSFSEFAGYLFYGVAGTKPIMLRLISLLNLSILHEINFKSLVLTGNIFLLLLSFVFWISTVNINKYLIITAACFIFQPQYWEAIYQSTGSNSIFSCLFFSLASIYCITQKNTPYYAASIVFVVLAQISFGNGYMVYPILLMISIYHKNIRLFVMIFIIMTACTYLYSFGGMVSLASGGQLGLLTKLKLWSLYLFEFLGSSLGYAFSSGYDRDVVGKTASIIIGLMIVVFYIFLIKKKYYYKNLFMFSTFTFFILTALLTTKLRFIMEVPGASRYQVQSALCTLTVLIIIVDLYATSMNKYVVIMLTVVFPMMFVIASYRTNLPTVSGHKTRLAIGLWSWVTYGNSMTLTIWAEQEAAANVLRQSINKNFYKIPSRESLITEAYK